MSTATWAEYKTTFRSENPCFEEARTGNIAGVSQHLSGLSHLDEKNAKGHTLLMLAAYNGHLQLTNLLLKASADPNSTDADGNSILMGVAFKGHLAVAKELIRFGADTQYRNPKGQTAAQFAAMFGKREVASLLGAKQGGFLPAFKAWLIYLWQGLTPRPLS
jgi:uncharacterized protein